MNDRIAQELDLLRRYYPDVEYREDGSWVRIARYPAPEGVWEQSEVSVCFQIPVGYPGQAPYAFYVQPGLRLKATGQKPNNYEEPSAGVPFEGIWGKISWAHDVWRPTADLVSGSNLLNFVRTFQDRLKEGA